MRAPAARTAPTVVSTSHLTVVRTLGIRARASSFGYALGTAFLQLGCQAGGALTVAGLATLLTNAVPIAAGTIVLDEPVPAPS